jgi:hypothetical protein
MKTTKPINVEAMNFNQIFKTEDQEDNLLN